MNMASRRFVIPDIQGCARTFRALLEDVIRLNPWDSLYLLGDYIDRGPRSRELLDIILKLRKKGFSVHALRGNHEEMLLNSDNSPSDFHLWLENGGRQTLDSFGVERTAEIPSHYVTLLAQLPYFILLEDFVLVHACLNFELADPFIDREAMLWSRNCEVDTWLLGNRRLINGHLPVPRETLLQSLSASRITLDNGCVYKGRTGLGSLAALELNSMNVFFQENID
jgi:serine/threonine protein phosphatase 1